MRDLGRVVTTHLIRGSHVPNVRTAGQIVDELDAPTVSRSASVSNLGPAEGPQALVSTSQLGVVLRQLLPAVVDLQLSPASSWYTLRAQPGGVSVEADTACCRSRGTR